MQERPLSALRTGDRATIGRLDGSGPVRRRLLELGLTPGTPVTLVRLAPLRDPMQIRVRGYQLCVRRSEADAVWVQAEPSRQSDESPVPIPVLACAGSKGGAITTAGHMGAARSFFRLFRHR
jgi:ferrous iron transport protein A